VNDRASFKTVRYFRLEIESTERMLRRLVLDANRLRLCGTDRYFRSGDPGGENGGHFSKLVLTEIEWLNFGGCDCRKSVV